MVPTTRSSNAKPTLEIIPSTKFVVFEGGEHEAQPVTLSGIVRLTAPDAMSISKPRIRLEGKRKVSWLNLCNLTYTETTDKKCFWEQEQKLGSVESTHKVKRGVIEWAFEFELSPAMPESVEGLMNTYLVYQLQACVSRPGWNAKDVVASQHIRIVRTLGMQAMETTRSRVNSDIWANKVSYSISIPTDAFIFGTSISADVELSPIKKGLELGKIDLRLIETTVKRIQAAELPDTRSDRSRSDDAEVARTTMDFPQNSKVMYEDETVDNPVQSDEMYKFQVTLPLPTSLKKCRPDVDSHAINITHKFKISINLMNPEGHTSQLVCRLPVKIFISPHLPIGNDSLEVDRQANAASDEVLNNTETALAAPPEYGRHLLDQLFSDMDPAGGATRPPSRSPSHGSVRSRSDSGSDNDFPDGGALVQHGSASPMALRSRLAHLQNGELSRAGSSQGVSPSGGNSPAPGSAPLSRRTSDEHESGPQSAGYDINDLSRVPSYGHALRTPGFITPLNDGPPTYVEATSRPSSRPSSPHQRPMQAHLRIADGSPTQLGSSGLSNGITTLDLDSLNAEGAGGALRLPPRSHSRRSSAASNDGVRNGSGL